ncbi:hypothetical protein ABVT39_012661 [Epinephelus coioides]
MPHSTHCIIHRVTEEVVAIRHKVIYLPKTADDVAAVVTACAVLHNICLGAGDIMAPEGEVLDDMSEDEGENGLEAVSGAL